MENAGKDHDYDPTWDYEVLEDRPGGALGLLLDEVEAAARGEILPALGMPGMDLFLAAEGGLGEGALGRYIDGTSTWPVIGLDLAALEERCGREGLDLRHEIRATVAHELAHAWQEAAGLDDSEHEDEAEEFGQVWAGTGRVAREVLGANGASGPTRIA